MCVLMFCPKGETGGEKEREREVLCVWKRKETDQYWLPLLVLHFWWAMFFTQKLCLGWPTTPTVALSLGRSWPIKTLFAFVVLPLFSFVSPKHNPFSSSNNKEIFYPFRCTDHPFPQMKKKSYMCYRLYYILAPMDGTTNQIIIFIIIKKGAVCVCLWVWPA